MQADVDVVEVMGTAVFENPDGCLPGDFDGHDLGHFLPGCISHVVFVAVGTVEVAAAGNFEDKAGDGRRHLGCVLGEPHLPLIAM